MKHTNREIKYDVIAIELRHFISNRETSTSDFIAKCVKQKMSTKEAHRLIDYLSPTGLSWFHYKDKTTVVWNTKHCADGYDVQYRIDSSFATEDKIKSIFENGKILSTRGRIPGAKSIPEKKQTSITIYPGWESTITI